MGQTLNQHRDPEDHYFASVGSSPEFARGIGTSSLDSFSIVIVVRGHTIAKGRPSGMSKVTVSNEIGLE
jgi:hypothetical protein